MRHSLVVRASGCQCKRYNSPTLIEDVMKNLVMYDGCRRTKLYIWRKWFPTLVTVKCILHIEKFRPHRKIPTKSEKNFTVWYRIISTMSEKSDDVGKFWQCRKILSAHCKQTKICRRDSNQRSLCCGAMLIPLHHGPLFSKKLIWFVQYQSIKQLFRGRWIAPRLDGKFILQSFKLCSYVAWKRFTMQMV